MSELTPEFVQNVELSKNPFVRHGQVRDILENELYIGDGAVFETRLFDVEYQGGEAITRRRSISIKTERGTCTSYVGLFLGRKALKETIWMVS